VGVNMVDEGNLQNLLQELQLVRSQIQTLTSQSNEISVTIEALKSQSPDRSVYRAIGGILLEVENREELDSDLVNSKNAIEEHLARLQSRENEIKNEYSEALKSLEN
tara:strand:- start:139846 stop:140166 length:321 start_codon:yes stop_codon:yes gene_type:complete